MAEEGEERGIEQQIESAVRSRLQHFRDQADSLTMESVRRLLEKDLGLEKNALDTHKRFIRQYLEKQMDAADDLNSRTVAENVDKDININKEEATGSPILGDAKRNSEKPRTEDQEMVDDSHVMSVLTPKSEADHQGSPVSKSTIEKAILERADYFRTNSENITLAGVRRLLEEDLGLEKNTLNPYKKFISHQIDQVLDPLKGAKSAKDVKKKISDHSRSKKSENVNIEEEGSDLSGGESEKMEDEDVPRRKSKKTDEPKKRKGPNIASKKQKKLPKKQKEEVSDSDDRSASENGRPRSPIERSTEKKEKTAPGYGKQVEHLKSIIKACGMSVPPSIYKKAKQVPDTKREAFLVKELEEILSREGLSKKPTEKEIKDCKKRKETARELEGIDMSNIISSSRRRSTFSFLAPPKPESRGKGENSVAKDGKNKVKNGKDKNDEKKEEKEPEKKPEEEPEKKPEEKAEKKPEEKAEEREEEEEDEDEEEEEEEEDDDDAEEEDDESEEFNEDDNEESD